MVSSILPAHDGGNRLTVNETKRSPRAIGMIVLVTVLAITSEQPLTHAQRAEALISPASQSAQSSAATGPAGQNAQGRNPGTTRPVTGTAGTANPAVASAQPPDPNAAAPVVTPQGQPPAEATPPTEPNPATDLLRRIEQLRTKVADAQLDEIVRTDVEQQLMRAEADIQSAQGERAAADARKKVIDGLPAEKADLEQPAVTTTAFDPSAVSVADLEARRTQKQLELTEARQLPTSPEAASEEMTARKRDLQQQRETVEQSITENDTRLKSLPSDSTSLTDSVARAAAEARNLQLSAQRDALQAAQAEIDTRLALGMPALRARRQQRVVTSLEQELEAIKAALEKRSRDESTKQLQKAQLAVDDLDSIDDPKLRSLVQKRLNYAALNNGLTDETIPQKQSALDRGGESLKRLKVEADRIQQSVREFGLSGTIGRELLDFQQRLPTGEELDREIAELDQEIATLRTELNQYAQDLAAAETMADASEVSEDEDSIRRAEQIQGSIDVIRALQDNTTRLKTIVGELYEQQRSLADFRTAWDEYVSEQALWVRSHEMLSWTDLKLAPREGVAIVDELRRGLPDSASRGGVSLWVVIVPAVVAILLLLAVQERARRALVETGEQARRRTCMSMRPTVKAVLLSFGMAAEWPLLLMFLGNVLRFSSGTHGVFAGLGAAIAQLGIFTLWLNFFRQFLRRDGLAAAHFAWEESVNDRLRHWLRNVIVGISPPLLLLLIVRYCATGEERLERILFTFIMALNSVMLARLLLPVNCPFVRTLLARHRVMHNTRILWIGLLLTMPVALGTLSVIGFHYTAVQLWIRLSSTVVIASLLLVADSFLVRWLRLSHRASRMAMARERAAQREQQQQAESAEESAASLIPPIPADDDGLALFGLQAHSLIRNVCILTLIGCSWAIWFDVLPALKVLDRQELWSVSEQVTISDPASSDPAKTTTVIEKHPVTVGSLILAAFSTIVTIVAVRQLPGLIEIILLSRVKFESGIRYAITTVTRYLVLVAGVMIVFGLLGLRWSQVQWLVAGLSVGLGFGLQEVFANFVSGIIILLERPVRIGDIVTIDGVSGVVSRIQIRATSITDWDRREYIVPNKEFVTGKLLNWTLSDTTNRIVIKVGVAYGSNTDQAREIILQTAKDHPNVLADPPPLTTFENFGDSSLDLVLRAYLPNLENRLNTISELHTEINHRLAAAGISIPFPQRDLHVFMNKTAETPGLTGIVASGTDDSARK
ncbi:MAG: mechanosensitive ion channel [Planctomycetaceae bacterium]